MTIYTLHGFLGLPSDWDFLQSKETVQVDLSKLCPPRLGLKQWAVQFNEFVQNTQDRNIIMGYSLGGRLAMHALMQNPALWDAAILISAHPGLDPMADRNKRLASDLAWAERFHSESWEPLMAAWNNQEAFKGSSALMRHENAFSRDFLADALSYWSLARQDYLLPDIIKLQIPILWIAGENDIAYASRARSLKLKHTNSKIWIAPHAGHRVPWDAPLEFKQQIHKFVTQEVPHAHANNILERN